MADLTGWGRCGILGYAHTARKGAWAMGEGALLSTQEVGGRLALDDSTIRRMLYKGEFPNAFKAGRAWKIPESDLEAYIEEKRRERRAAASTSEES